MKLHEHQAKEILKKYNLPVPEGKVAFSLQKPSKWQKSWVNFPWWLKPSALRWKGKAVV
jgi:succinyl-CoA synthetase (ADP-forming) beta subunit (EC 6.2.1.5)